MIIELFLNVLYAIFSILTLPINLPNLPSDIYQYLTEAFSYMSAGAGIVANYAPLAYIMVLFGVILAIDVGINVYHFVMWVLKKIPLAGIS